MSSAHLSQQQDRRPSPATSRCPACNDGTVRAVRCALLSLVVASAVAIAAPIPLPSSPLDGGWTQRRADLTAQIPPPRGLIAVDFEVQDPGGVVVSNVRQSASPTSSSLTSTTVSLPDAGFFTWRTRGLDDAGTSAWTPAFPPGPSPSLPAPPPPFPPRPSRSEATAARTRTSRTCPRRRLAGAATPGPPRPPSSSPAATRTRASGSWSAMAPRCPCRPASKKARSTGRGGHLVHHRAGDHRHRRVASVDPLARRRGLAAARDDGQREHQRRSPHHRRRGAVRAVEAHHRLQHDRRAVAARGARVGPPASAEWAGGDSNPYSLRNQILSLARLPVTPPARVEPAAYKEKRPALFRVTGRFSL